MPHWGLYGETLCCSQVLKQLRYQENSRIKWLVKTAFLTAKHKLGQCCVLFPINKSETMFMSNSIYSVFTKYKQTGSRKLVLSFVARQDVKRQTRQEESKSWATDHPRQLSPFVLNPFVMEETKKSACQTLHNAARITGLLACSFYWIRCQPFHTFSSELLLGLLSWPFVTWLGGLTRGKSSACD